MNAHSRTADTAAPLTSILDETLDVLSSSPAAALRFREEQRWLTDRKDQWARSHWRVGLLGVTSSGKSTLINALLGEPLLPSAVRPSSNGLVICARGDSLFARVYYEDGRTIVLRSDIARKLQLLGDEQHNPANRAGVKEVHLFSPRFRLDPKIALVDSPGLDAHGLQSHEDLTLKLLLPTLDAAVFLTTAKANSDDRIASYVDLIGQAGKPLIVAQNMIDTVEAKLGIGGRVVKTREEVADEHRARLRRLLERSMHSGVRAAPIVQVSARLGLDALSYKASRMGTFVATVDQSVERLAPALEAGRRRQLAAHLRQLTDAEMIADDTADVALRSESAALERRTHELESALTKLSSEMNAEAKSLIRAGERLVAAVDRLGRGETEPACRLSERAREWARSVPGAMQGPMETAQQAFAKIADRLNLRSEDYARVELPRHQAPTAIHVERVVREKHVRRERNGVVASVARFFGLGGYETEVMRWSEVNLDALHEQLEQLLMQQRAWLKRAQEQVDEVFRGYSQRIEREIARRRKGLEARRLNLLTAAERQRIAACVRAIWKRLGQPSADAGSPVQTVAAERDATEPAASALSVPRYAVAALRLADLVARQRFAVARDLWLARRKWTSPPRLLIWGWDADALEQFCTRFFAVTRLRRVAEGLVVSDPAPPFSRLAVVDETHAQANVSTAEASAVGLSDTAVFLLLDAFQPGATESQLTRSALLPQLRHAAACVPVVQSVAGHWGTSSVAPALAELRQLLRRQKVRCDGVLANSDDLRVSALVDQLVHQRVTLETQRDEVVLLKRLGYREAGDAATSIAAEVLRQWRMEAKSNHPRT